MDILKIKNKKRMFGVDILVFEPGCGSTPLAKRG